MRAVERRAVVLVLLDHSVPDVAHHYGMSVILGELNAGSNHFKFELEVVQTLHIVAEGLEQRVRHEDGVVGLIEDARVSVGEHRVNDADGDTFLTDGCLLRSIGNLR